MSEQTFQGGLALQLKRAEEAVRLRLQPALDEADLHLEHWRILSVLMAQPGLPMASLAEAAVVPGASLTRHMDRLVERALVIRRVDPHDRRRVVAALSVRGTELALRLRAEESAAESALGWTTDAGRLVDVVRVT
jgi:DNA-binding MarR family transcriptional regulator